MTTLATAAVDIVANTAGFEDDLRRQLDQAGAGADRAAQQTGRRLGASIQSGISSAAARTGQAISAVGRSAQTALSPALNSLGRFRDGFQDAGAAASAFSGRMGTMGGAARRALDPALGHLGRFRDGFQDAGAAASAFSGRMGTIGGAARRAIDPVVNGLGRFRDGFGDAGAAASAFSGRMGTMGGAARSAVDGIASGFGRVGSAVSTATSTAVSGLSDMTGRMREAITNSSLLESGLGQVGAVAAGLAAAAGVASLGTEIVGVASSAQTTRASVTALYGAAGAGAEEVNALMAEMSTRFKGLDMSVMNEGATTLAYMGLQGTEAVDVLERLDAATTAAGTGATGMTRALDAMTKGVNAGKFMMGELSQISNAGIPIYDALSEVLGVSIPEAQAMASDGAVELSHVLEALGGEAGVWFPALLEGATGVGNTFAGSWDTMRSTFVNGIAFELLPLMDRLAPIMVRAAETVGAGFERLPQIIESTMGGLRASGVMDTLTGALEGVRGVMSALAPVTAGFSSGFTSVVRGAADLIGQLAPLTGELGTVQGFLEDNADALRTLGVALGAVVATLATFRAATAALALTQAVVVGTGRAINTLLGITRAWSVITTIATAANKLFAASFKLIGVAIRGIPVIGWIIGLIGLLIGAITLLWQRSERFRDIVTTAWGQVQDVIGSAVQSIMGFVDRLKQGWDDLMDSASDSAFWSGAWASLVSQAQTAGAAVSAVIDQIRATVAFLGALLRGDDVDFAGFVREGVDRFRELGEAVTEHIIESLRRLPSMAAEAVGALTNAIVSSLSGLSSSMGSVDIMGWLSGATTQAVDYLSGVGTTIVDYLKSIPAWVSDNIDPAEIWDWLKDAGNRIGEFMSDYGPQILKALGVAIGVAVLGVPALIIGLGAALIGTLGFVAWELLKWGRDAFSDMMTGAGNSIRDGLSDLGAWFAGLPAIAGQHLAALGATIVDFFSAIPDQVASMVGADDGLLEWMKELPGKAQEYLTELGQTIAQDLIGRIEAIPGQIRSAVGADDGVIGWMKDLPAQATEYLTDLGTTISDYLTSLPGRVKDAVTGPDGLLDWLKDSPAQAIDYLTDLGKTIVDYVKSIPDLVKGAVSGDGGDNAFLEWLKEAPSRAGEYLTGLGETIVDYVKGIPDWVSDNIDPGALWDWLKDSGTRIYENMLEWGPQLLKGIAIAIGIVVLAIPALLLGLLAAILYVLGVIAWELAQWAWAAFSDMMVTAGQAIGAGLSNVVAWFQALPGRVLESLANFGTQLHAWGAGALAALRGAFSSGLSSLLGLWSSTWTSLRITASTALTSLVSWAATQAANLRDRVMTPINTLKDRMIGAFRSAREGIGEAWDGLRSTVGKPIEWVVNTGYNNWLRGVWGKVVEKFGGPALPSYTVQFAKGGIFPGNGGGVFSGYTPGRDVHAMPMAAFSGGESVLRPEVTKAWGSGTTLMLNKLARTGGVGAVRKALAMLFAGQNPFNGMSVPRANPAGAGGGFAQRFSSGGILGTVGGSMASMAAWLNSAVDDFSEAMLDFLDDPGGMLKKLFEQIMDYSSMPGWGSGFTEVLSGVPKKIIDMLVDKAKDLFSIDSEGDWINVGGNVGGRLGAALRFAKAQAGKPYVWGGVGPRGYDCSGLMSSIHNVIMGQNPYRRRYTTHSFNGTMANGFRRNFPSPFTIGNTHASVGHMAGTLLRTNVESRGSAGVVVGSRARGTTNPLFTSRWGLITSGSSRGGRMGGEGLLYDGGGTLWPGTHLVSNKSGKPESIRTYAQEERVSRLVRAVERQSAQVARTPLVPVDQVGALERALGIRGRSHDREDERARVYAPITVNSQVSDPTQVAHKVVDRLVTKAGV